MTSRERVLKAFNHEKSDRLPVDYSGNDGINRRLIEHFKVNSLEEVLQALKIDFRSASVSYIGKPLHENSVENRNIDPLFGVVTRYIEHSGGGYWDFCDFPLAEADYETVKNWKMPSPDDYDYDATLSYCRENKDYALYLGNAGLIDCINGNTRLRGMEQVLVDLLTEDEAGLLLLDRRLEVEYSILERLLSKCHEYITFVWVGEDLGTTHTPIISQSLFKKQIRPRHQKFIDLIKSYNLPVMFHSCGYSSWAFPDFIEMGIDAVDTLQPEAINMSPQYLKENFGQNLAFHGCISTGYPLSGGTPEEVFKSASETIEILKPTYGYMFSPCHMVQNNTPVENILKLYKAAEEHGKY